MDLSILVLGSPLQARQAYKRLCGVLREKGSPQAHMFERLVPSLLCHLHRDGCGISRKSTSVEEVVTGGEPGGL